MRVNCFLNRILVLLAVNLVALSQATIIDNGKLAVVDGINYYVGGVPVSRLSPVPSSRSTEDTELLPITVIRSTVAGFTNDDLDGIIGNFSRKDDVFQRGFLEALFVAYTGHGQGHISSSFKTQNTKLVMASSNYNPQGSVVKADLSVDIPQGPYFMSTKTGSLYQAYRLYPDHQLAFTEAAISDGNGGFKPLPAATQVILPSNTSSSSYLKQGAMTKSVAVPSRLYYTPTPNKPLSGLRLGIKDIFHVKGLRTSGGNRAFYNFYPPQNKTGSAVQRLIDAGAVFVGKMGTVQFANGDNPTADWVDFHCPFNPRGDGYQAPGGSSSGPAAGIASYDWLDIAVGSDTSGSMRSPAGFTGLYANRPSKGVLETDGILPLSGPLDSVGVFARDARTWSAVMHAWYRGLLADYRVYPRRLFYSRDSFPDVTTEAGGLLEGVVGRVEKFLDVHREAVDTQSRWEETYPEGAPGNVSDLLNTTYAVLTSVYQYKHIAQPFFADYAEKRDGRRPFINPGPLVRWQWGQDNGGDTAYNEAVKNKTIFKDWWETDGYGLAHNETCSEGIYIYPYSTGKTQYRNVYTDAPTDPPMGFKDSRIATMAGAPDLVVPIGEVPYNSTVSLKTEYMPVTMSFVAARGCDLMLVNLVQELQDAGILKPVKTGATMYR